MNERVSIGAKLRFEVLKRDGFRCTYCGAPAQAKRLHIDHVEPVALGGTNDVENLVAACVDCNLGKSDVSLNDQLHPGLTEDDAIARALDGIRNALFGTLDLLERYWERELGSAMPMSVRDAIPYLTQRLLSGYYIMSIIDTMKRAGLRDYQHAHCFKALAQSEIEHLDRAFDRRSSSLPGQEGQ